MSEQSEIFRAKSAIKAFDREHRRKINFNISRYELALPQGKEQFANLELARERAKNLKWSAISRLDTLLEEFEANIIRRGGKVVWARDAEEALTEIGRICRERNCRTVVKSKSMVTEEIHLNEYLEKQGIVSIETDLGEYIQQLDGEPPYHIVTPAMHKSKDDVAKLFSEKLGTDRKATPEQLTIIARNTLRPRYRQAEIGITGANFLIADPGAIAITENEGNARLSCSIPKTHIVIAGIEKMIPSLQDLSLFWPLLSSFGTGQRVTVYNSVVFGPRKAGETDGPEEFIVILLDNGRSNLLENEKARESLYCIRCGACLNVCPVYKNVGGHTYNTTYSGPIGAVVTPHLRGMENWKHLSYASSLCGRCTEACAVKINLHEQLLENRHESVQEGHTNFQEKMAWKIWKQAMLRRGIMNAGNSTIKNWIVGKLLKGWKPHRSDIVFPKKSFNQLWKEKRSN